MQGGSELQPVYLFSVCALVQHFSCFNVSTNHLEMLLKGRHRFSRSVVGPEAVHSNRLLHGTEVAGLSSTVRIANPESY